MVLTKEREKLKQNIFLILDQLNWLHIFGRPCHCQCNKQTLILHENSRKKKGDISACIKIEDFMQIV